MTNGFAAEVAIIDLLTLLVSVLTVEIVWYAAKKALPNEVASNFL
jgi:hypothetical protein